jgi:hypothetical protein
MSVKRNAMQEQTPFSSESVYPVPKEFIANTIASGNASPCVVAVYLALLSVQCAGTHNEILRTLSDLEPV